MPDFQVRPGDLITAELWNALSGYINNLESRIIQLEQAGVGTQEVVIDSLIFASPLRAGDPVSVLGRNFGAPGRIQVVFDDQTTLRTQVLAFSVQSSTRLSFEVPTLPGLPEAGRTSQLKITNVDTAQSASRAVHILPRLLPLQGNATIVWRSVAPNPFTGPITALFGADIAFETSRPGSFVIAPRLTGQSWNLSVLDNNRNVIVGGQVTTNATRETKQIFVAVDVPAGVTGQQFDLNAEISGGSVRGHTETLRASVGTTVQLPGSEVSVVQTGMEANREGAQLQGNTLSVPPGVRVRINFELREFKQAGRYVVSLTSTATTTGWQERLADVPDAGLGDPSGHFEVTQTEIDAGTRRACALIVEPTNTASNAGALDFAVQRQGSAAVSHHIYELLKT